MKVHPIGEPKVIMSNPDSKHNYFAWPSAAKLQNGKIAVCASGYRIAHICPFGKTVIAFSDDDGETYTSPMPVIDTVLDDRDGGLCTFGTSGLIVTSFNNSIKMQRERNARRSNNPYIEAYLNTVTPEEEEKYLGPNFRVSNDCGVTYGPIHIAPVTSPHGPIALNDGSILYVGCDHQNKDKPQDEPWKILAYRISPDGTSEYISTLPSIIIDGQDGKSCEPYAFQLQDGTILVHIRADLDFNTYQTKSTDGGKTWSVPRKILEGPGGAPSHIMQHSSGALICAYGCRKQPYSIRLAISYDGGDTWDSDHILYTNETTWDLGYPATVELDNGNLLTVFYCHQDNKSPAVIMQQCWSFTNE